MSTDSELSLYERFREEAKKRIFVRGWVSEAGPSKLGLLLVELRAFSTLSDDTIAICTATFKSDLVFIGLCDPPIFQNVTMPLFEKWMMGMSVMLHESREWFMFLGEDRLLPKGSLVSLLPFTLLQQALIGRQPLENKHAEEMRRCLIEILIKMNASGWQDVRSILKM